MIEDDQDVMYHEEFDDEDEVDERELDEYEEAMLNCGMTQDGACMLIGTEYCDWDCPFSQDMWRNLRRKRDAKGRFCK